MNAICRLIKFELEAADALVAVRLGEADVTGCAVLSLKRFIAVLSSARYISGYVCNAPACGDGALFGFSLPTILGVVVYWVAHIRFTCQGSEFNTRAWVCLV